MQKRVGSNEGSEEGQIGMEKAETAKTEENVEE